MRKTRLDEYLSGLSEEEAKVTLGYLKHLQEIDKQFDREAKEKEKTTLEIIKSLGKSNYAEFDDGSKLTVAEKAASANWAYAIQNPKGFKDLCDLIKASGEEVNDNVMRVVIDANGEDLGK